MRLPGRYYRAKHRAVNWIRDARGAWDAICLFCPDNGTPGKGGGYSFWRCGLDEGHEGLHRFGNYVSTDDGATSYAPIPYGKTYPSRYRDQERYPIMNRWQARNRRQWHAATDAKRRATR